jgi:oxalate decarboxylase/phosphoglucose isomerase-like protein (cupin superfamily)
MSPVLDSVPRWTAQQEPGSIMFVPSGWHHHVTNVTEVVLSINHNWFNASNLHLVWDFLKVSKYACLFAQTIKSYRCREWVAIEHLHIAE